MSTKLTERCATIYSSDVTTTRSALERRKTLGGMKPHEDSRAMMEV